MKQLIGVFLIIVILYTANKTFGIITPESREAAQEITESMDSSNPLQPAVNQAVIGIQQFALRDVKLGGQPVLERMQEQKVKQAQHAKLKQVQIRRVTKPVSECIKPNNVIDDEVQMCVNGTLEKYW